MDVRCDKCGSEYELDDTRVTTTGVNVKCTSCGNVFRVTKAAPQAAAMKGQATGDWMIRQASGTVFKFKELTTLQRWIVERRVTRDDEISKTGETWKRLGDILELASFFQVAEQAAIVPQQQGGLVGAVPIETTTGRMPAQKKRSALPTVLAIGMVLVALLAGGWLLRKELGFGKPSVPQAPPGAELAAGHIAAAQAELKKDTIAGYNAAEAELEKALQLQPMSAQALSAATFALAGAAELSKEDVAELEKTMKDAAAGKVKLSPAELATMATELGKKQADAAAKTERAFAYMKRTVEADTTQKLGWLAAARYYALTSSTVSFKDVVDKAQAQLADDASYNYAVGLLRRHDDSQLEGAVQSFQRAVEREPDHVGARYRLAQIAERRGEKERALALADEVLRRSPEHAHAAALKKRLSPAPVAVEVKPDEPPRPVQAESFETLLSRANKARQSERLKQALDLYGRALDMKPENAEALTGLGLVYLDMDQAGNAIGQFQKAVQANSRYSDAYMGLAEAYRARGQKRDAVKNYQKYLDLAPDGAESNVARQALKDLGQE